MSYTEIAKKTGLSISHVSRVHRGLTGVSMDALVRIAKAREMTIDQLVKEIAREKRAIEVHRKAV